MFCPNCGKQIDENTKFCPNCGYDLNAKAKEETPKTHYGSEKIFSLRPVFIPWVTALSALPLQIFFTIWGGMFFGGFSTVAIQIFHIKIPKASPFIFFAALFFFGIPFLAYYSKKKTYAKTVYTFYDDHLEYFEGFWTVEKKSIKYDRIAEVSMVEGIIQKKYGLGSIFLATPATGYSSRRARSGIRISDIPNAEKVYQEIKKLLEK